MMEPTTTYFENTLMIDKPSMVITNCLREEARIRLSKWHDLMSEDGIYTGKSDTPMVDFRAAVKGSRAPWAEEALKDIYTTAKMQQSPHKGGYVVITLDGEDLMVTVSRISSTNEFKALIAEPSIPALDKILIARRNQYDAQHGVEKNAS